MNLATSLSLPLILAALAACGGSPADPAAEASGTLEEVDCYLAVQIDGTDYRTTTRIDESGIKFASRLDAVLMSGAAGHPGGVPEISMGITTGSRRTGAFEIVRNPNKLREGKDLATLTLGIAATEGNYTGLQGTLNVQTLETEESETSYRIRRLTATFNGTFRDEQNEEHALSGELDFGE